jgi:hypothetical protein
MCLMFFKEPQPSLDSFITISHMPGKIAQILGVKQNTYPSRRIAFVMSSTFFLVSTNIIILFPLSTPSSLRSLDNLSKKRHHTTINFHKFASRSATSIYRWELAIVRPNKCGNEVCSLHKEGISQES